MDEKSDSREKINFLTTKFSLFKKQKPANLLCQKRWSMPLALQFYPNSWKIYLIVQLVISVITSVDDLTLSSFQITIASKCFALVEFSINEISEEYHL